MFQRIKNWLLVAVAEAFGVLFLWLPCLLGAYDRHYTASDKPWPFGVVDRAPFRPFVDQWNWEWLNAWYANPEDGVSGQYAWVWLGPGGTLCTYASTFPSWTPAWVIAYCWSALRNGAHNIKLKTGAIAPPKDP